MALLPLTLLPAAEITYTGISGGEWTTDANWNNGSYPATGDQAVLNTTANLSVETSNNIQGLQIGTSGSGRLQITSHAVLNASTSSSVTSRIGDGNGNEGSVQQEGGSVVINRLEIGRNSSNGSYHLHGGNFEIIRDTQSYSLFLGTNVGRNEVGNGTFQMSSGSFETRAGVYLGSTAGGIGRFEVIGSHPGFIGIGSGGNNLDGIWTQNSGSTLSVRIDKTSEGVTPIFIDDRGQNGGGNGDVIFENGSLLEVDFTGAFLNGGTFTVMEWEGDVIANGLQFAPSVDTNIWSFQVDAANKQLTVTATGNALNRDFVHPGLSHKRSDLERMRDMVAAGVEPYASSFAALSAKGRAQHTAQPSSAAVDLATNGGTANNNALRNDGITAYYNALMWFITGDSRHAEASIRIFTAWSPTQNIDGIPLDAGRHWRLIEAAEIIKSTYSGWDPGDLQAFKDMLVYPGYSNTSEPSGNRSIYWRAYQGDPARHGNQGLFAMRCVMAIGVFLDNEIMYDRALRYLQGAPARTDDIPYITGPSIANTQIATYEHFLEFNRTGEESTVANYGYNEVIHNYIYPNGQSQEFSRDMAHGLAGIGIIATMSEIAWSQSDDLYGHLDNRPLLGLEYYYRYNLSFVNSFPDQTSPWEPTVENGEFIQRLDQSGRWFSLKANPYLAQDVSNILRGTFNDDPVYEMNLAHYRDRMGVPSDDTKWLDRGLDLLIADEGFEGEGTPWDHPSWGGLTFRRTSPGDPMQGFSNGVPNFAMNELPMTIEAENYDYFPLDGEGRTYHDLTVTNAGLSYRPVGGVDLSSASEGNFTISNIEANEWVTYTVSVPMDADYDLAIRYASTAPGGTIRFSLDGNDITGNVTIPHGAPGSTGDSDWQTLAVAYDLPLTQGVKQLTVSFGGTSNSFLLNNFSIELSPLPIVPPIAHWRFDEGLGNVAADCSGNGYHGTINNATWTTRTGGGNALSFNGTNANVSLPANAFSSIDDEITFTFWAFGDASLPSENSAFWAGNSGGSRILNVHLPWADSKVYFDASDRISKTASATETEGAWVHWAFAKDAAAGAMRIYRNGILWHSGTGQTNSISTIAQAFIGSQNNTRYYPGLIDDFRLYDVALTDATIAQLYVDSQNTSPEDHLWAAGDSLNVSFTDLNGTAGTSWDLLTVNCPLILDSSLAPSTPFQITLSAPDLSFDSTSDQSWLLVTANEILGSFDANDFVIDSAAFEANNPLNGGSFSFRRLNNEFYLDFTAPQFTALENWRFLHFGTYADSGIAANDFDADLDGLANLVEYATNLNPNDSSDSCAFQIASSPTNPDELQVTFHRIADANLSYMVEGSPDLSASSWSTIWNSFGNSAGLVTLPEALWPSNEPTYFLRLKVSN
ncbi:MAG: LamG-like jellyroll fold domain-containing protein [Roseibacillus sp.]